MILSYRPISCVDRIHVAELSKFEIKHKKFEKFDHDMWSGEEAPSRLWTKTYL